MSLTKIDAFSIPLFFTSLGDQVKALNNELISDLENELKTNRIQMRSAVGINQTKVRIEQEYESFKKLKTIMDEVTKDIPNIVGIENSQPNTSHFWGNIDTNPYGFNMPHSHSLNHLFSGVYFPTSGFYEDENGERIYDESDTITNPSVNLKAAQHPGPGDLVLMDPLEFCKGSLINKSYKRYPYWGLPLCLTPKEGSLVIFPSYLPHMVTPTKKENYTRISIAFLIDM